VVSSLQVQARALGDPTRHEIFRYLVDAGTDVDVAELTDHVGLNHNAVRQHLAKLVDAELVEEARARPSGRGRPRLLYRVAPTAESRWGVAGPYERLAVLLAEVVRTGDAPEAVGARAGRRLIMGGSGASVDAVARFEDAMARQGFDPTVQARGDEVEVVLRSCPLASAVLADADTVCQLHLGLARGAAEAIGGIEVDQLEPKDPRRAHCRLRCHLTGSSASVDA
jgi:predicted ArsR family transcriptional regulator